MDSCSFEPLPTTGNQFQSSSLSCNESYYPDCQLPTYCYFEPVYMPTSMGGYNNYQYANEAESLGYIHAPVPTQLPAAYTILDQTPSACIPFDSISHALSQSQNPVTPSISPSSWRSSVQQTYLLDGASSHSNNIDSASTFSSPTDDACSSFRQPASSKPAIVRKKLVLKANEIRRRRADKRRARMLEISSVLSFRATNPDILTTHETKRLYARGLEEYVLWLEGQVRMVGQQPRATQKVHDYKGICTRSLRTMLAHFQDEAEALYKQLKQKERNFLKMEEKFFNQVIMNGYSDSFALGKNCRA